MRLYPSSEGLGERAGALLVMVNGAPFAVMTKGKNARPSLARDFHHAESQDPLAEFRVLGVEPAWLDLRAHFGDSQSLRQRLAGNVSRMEARRTLFRAVLVGEVVVRVDAIERPVS